MENLETLLVWNDGTKRYEERLMQKVLKYEKIIIFGAGIGGKITLELLIKNGMKHKVCAFSDNDVNKTGAMYYGFPVIVPQLIKRNYDKSIILVSSTAFDIILNQLIELGIDEEDVFYFQPAGMSLEDNYDVQFIKEHIVEFNTVYNLLEDVTSKMIYKYLLNYRISKDEIWLEKMKAMISEESEQYFDKNILNNYSFNDGFVDGGGYRGDTIDSFYIHYPQWDGTYYCLEAVEDTFAKLSKHVDKLYGNKKIILMNYAIWNEEGSLNFDTVTYGNGAGSKVSSRGGGKS